MSRRRNRFAALCLLLVFGMLLVGFTPPVDGTDPEKTDALPDTSPEPDPYADVRPAQLLTGVETGEKVVSIVFEGWAEADVMDALMEVLRKNGTQAMFSVSGLMANEAPELVQRIVREGFPVGNDGISPRGMAEAESLGDFAHQFERARQIIAPLSGRNPTAATLNGVEGSEDVLRGAAAAGINEVVQGNAFANHHSFAEADDATQFVSNLVRGSVIVVKIGQELSEEEFGQSHNKLDEKPAADPSPFIGQKELDTVESERMRIVDGVSWLLDSLAAQGYSVVLPEDLQRKKESLLMPRTELSESFLETVNPENYPVPVTKTELEAGKTHAGELSELSGAVIVGDAVTEGLHQYVLWKQKAGEDCLPGVRFLTSVGASLEHVLSEPLFALEEDPLHRMTLCDALSALEPTGIYLMIRPENLRAYSEERYMINYRLLISEIRKACPGVPVVVQSIPPASAAHAGAPTNAQVFSLNLMLLKMCVRYGIPFVDTAFAVRGGDGCLKPEYCMDETVSGRQLSGGGCEAWIDALKRHIP